MTTNILSRIARIYDAVTTLWENQAELTERYLLLQRPWEEDFLHWAWTGDEWVLHGTTMPPRRGRRSTTRSGWCPALLDPQAPRRDTAER